MDASRCARAFSKHLAWRSWLLPSMRPVGAADWPLGLMRSAGRHPIMRTSSMLVDQHGFCRPRSDRSCHHLDLRPRSSWPLVIGALPSRVSGRPVRLAAAQHRPEDAGEFVGDRRDDDVERPARAQAVDPRPQLAGAALADPDQGAGTVDQLAAQVAVAALAQAQAPRLAAGAVL